MKFLFAVYRRMNALSIDIATGSVVSALFLSRLLGSAPSFQVLICLGLTVWLIYTSDHLLDAGKLKGKASSYRHRFHQEHFKALLFCTGIVCFVIFLLLFTLPESILVRGAVLAVLVFLYFGVHQKLYFLKELLGAVLYSGGVLLPAIVFKNTTHLQLSQIIVLLLFITTVLLNLILFSWFDLERDVAGNHQSLVTTLGEKSNGLLRILFGAQFCLVFLTLTMTGVIAYTLILLAMNAALVFIFYKWNWFSINDRYRMAGDAIFFFPLVILWLV